jgi:predicted PurR-regulated permease PerM
MVLAASLGDFLWSLFVIFFMVCYFMILFRIIVDVFRRPVSGWNKAVWLLFIFFLPLIGILTYLIVHSGDMAERDIQEAQAAQTQFDSYVRDVAGGNSAAQIAQAKQLLDSGAITADEYASLKAKALAGGTA